MDEHTSLGWAIIFVTAFAFMYEVCMNSILDIREQARLLTQTDMSLKLYIADLLQQYWVVKNELRTGFEIGDR